MRVSGRCLAAWLEATKQEKRRRYGDTCRAVVFHRRSDLLHKSISRNDLESDAEKTAGLSFILQDPATQVFLHVAEVRAAERLDREKRPQYRVYADQGLPHPAGLRAGPGELKSDSN